MPLKVSGAFHSPLMQPAVAGLDAALREVTFRTPIFPVIANANAQVVNHPVAARELLQEQLTAPVRWSESLIVADNMAPDATWIEIGPGTVLGGLLRKTLPGPKYISLGTAAEVEAFFQ